jgi:hypothetical protein
VPRRTHPLLLIAALALGALVPVGLVACGGGSSPSAQTLDQPPLTVDTGATLPTSSTATTATATTTTTTSASGGASSGSSSAGAPTGAGGASGATGGGTGTGGQTGNGGGGASGGGAGGGGGQGTTPKASNPGGAAPDYQSFCNQNPGAC